MQIFIIIICIAVVTTMVLHYSKELAQEYEEAQKQKVTKQVRLEEARIKYEELKLLQKEIEREIKIQHNRYSDTADNISKDYYAAVIVGMTMINDIVLSRTTSYKNIYGKEVIKDDILPETTDL